MSKVTVTSSAISSSSGERSERSFARIAMARTAGNAPCCPLSTGRIPPSLTPAARENFILRGDNFFDNALFTDPAVLGKYPENLAEAFNANYVNQQGFWSR